MKMVLLTIWLAALLGACSGSGSSGDGGGLDAFDGGGDDGQPHAVCPQADDDFQGIRLRFEPGAQACTGFHDFANWQSGVEWAGRITFIPGSYPLEEYQPADVEADWVERLELGQDRQAATKLGPARLWYEFLDTGVPDEGCHRYHYEQPFSLAQEQFILFGVTTFCLDAGVPQYPEYCVWSDFTRGRLSFRSEIGNTAGTNDYQSYGPCYYHHLPLWIISMQVENGDSLVLHKRFEIPGGGSGPARIVQAEGLLSSSAFLVEDPIRMVYAAEHHNWNQEYVVIFDPPMGDVRGLYTVGIEEGAAPATLRYLDANLGELRTAVMTDIDIQGPL